MGGNGGRRPWSQRSEEYEGQSDRSPLWLSSMQVGTVLQMRCLWIRVQAMAFPEVGNKKVEPKLKWNSYKVDALGGDWDGQWSKLVQTPLESDGFWNSGSVLPVILSKLLTLSRASPS